VHLQVPHPSRAAAARALRAERTHSLTNRSFERFADAHRLLDRDRTQLERSRDLLDRARAKCSHLDDAASRANPVFVEGEAPAALAPAPTGEAARPRCNFTGCAAASRFSPCFVVDRGRHRVLVRDIPLRVCSDHRVDLEAMFQREVVLETLRRKLRAAGQGEPDSVRVLFEVVG
jgi:hypothetical protein